ncbi:MAG: hypothetical protein ACHQRM_05605 [Bacteroidia bacterium]
MNHLAVLRHYCLLLFLFLLPAMLHSQSIDSSQWLTGLTGGPTYEYRNIKLADHTTANNGDAYEVSSHKAKTGFTLGVVFEYKTTRPGLYLCCGLIYEDKGFVSNRVDTSYSYFPSLSGTSYSSIPDKYTYKEEYVYRSFSIPLTLCYRHRFGKLVLFATGGLMIELPTNTYSYTYWKSVNSEYTTMSESHWHHSFNEGLMLNAGAGILLHNNLLLTILPGFIQDLSYNDKV